MESVEFRLRLRNGLKKSSEIPPEWRGSFKNRVRVILQAEATSAPTKNLIDQLLARPVRLKTFRPVPREELHAR